MSAGYEPGPKPYHSRIDVCIHLALSRPNKPPSFVSYPHYGIFMAIRANGIRAHIKGNFSHTEIDRDNAVSPV